MRAAIEASTNKKLKAFGSGILTTLLLQSSTATTLLTISLLKQQILNLSAAMAVVLGADLATTFVVQILSLDISWLKPFLLIIGVILYLSTKTKGSKRYTGQIFIGLSLMLQSLDMIRDAAAPIRDAEILPLILSGLHTDPLFVIIFSALLTWLIHSSVASILLIASFAVSGAIDIHTGLLMVIGANIGGSIIPFIATYKSGPEARRVTLSNLAMRSSLCFALYISLPFWEIYLNHPLAQDIPPAHLLAHAHTGFNLLLVLLFLPILGKVQKITSLFIKSDSDKPNPFTPLYLDKLALTSPPLALAQASRETIRIAELSEAMLRECHFALTTNNMDLVRSIKESDYVLDALYNDIKLYITELSEHDLSPKDAQRSIQILTFATNIEHIGDIIDKSLMDLAEKRIKQKSDFSKEGLEELDAIHAMVLSNMQLAQSTFLTNDPALAQALLDQKIEVAKAAEATLEKHFKRLGKGQTESIGSSTIHLDVVRDYQRINSYLTRIAKIIDRS